MAKIAAHNADRSGMFKDRLLQLAGDNWGRIDRPPRTACLRRLVFRRTLAERFLYGYSVAVPQVKTPATSSYRDAAWLFKRSACLRGAVCVEPDVRISRIRLSDWPHREAHGTNHSSRGVNSSFASRSVFQRSCLRRLLGGTYSCLRGQLYDSKFYIKFFQFIGLRVGGDHPFLHVR
jgi:hypothetical protein